jgi:hypothetical protein
MSAESKPGTSAIAGAGGTVAPAMAIAATEPGAGPALVARVRELERTYRHIETTRMAGLGLTHPGLAVAAVGFAPEAAGGAAGVLVTPWFMNLVWLPDHEPARLVEPVEPVEGVEPAAKAQPLARVLAVGESRARRIGGEVVEFLGAYEAGLGPFETCSLFSPMFEFVDQAAALATAAAVMRLLRQPPADVVSRKLPQGAEPVPARRAFLLGGRAA